MSVHDAFKGFPAIGLTPQQPPVSQGFSGNGRGPGSLADRFEQRRYNHLGEHTPPLSRVSKQPYANEHFPQKVQYHHETYPQSAAPSPAQSRVDNMFSQAKEYATNFLSQQYKQHQQEQQQQQHQQQRPHTRGPSSLEIQRTKALLTLGLSPNSNPTRTDVKRAFKKAAFENHPDKAPDETADRTKKFIEANEAYKFLISNLRNQNGGNMEKIGGNNTIKRRHKKHKLAKNTRSKKHSNRRNKTRGNKYIKTRKNTTKRR